jgi:hypothetical protein
MNADKTIDFHAKLEFKGSLKDFRQLQSELGKLNISGLMIDTVPMPDDKSRGMMIDTVPLPEKMAGSLMIGTWPTPEKKGSTVMIDTVPMPERPRLPGIQMVTKLLGTEKLNELAKDMPRFKLIKDIRGGIRTVHLHMGDEVVLLNKDRFRDMVSQIATELGKELKPM